jgi:hypothetical protein
LRHLFQLANASVLAVDAARFRGPDGHSLELLTRA